MIRSIFLIFLLAATSCRHDSGIGALPGDGSCQPGACASRAPGFHDPAWAPDGTRIAVVKSGWETSPPGLYTIQPDGSDLRAVLIDSDVRTPAWSPDATSLLAIVGTDVLRMPLDGSPPQRLTSRGSFSRIDVHPTDGRILAYFDPRTRKAAQNELNRAGVVMLTPEGSNPGWIADGWMAAWTSDGQAFWLVERLPANPSATRLIRYDAASFSRTDTLALSPARFIAFPRTSPNGDRILFSGTRLHRHSFASRTTVALTTSGAERSTWNPDGSQVAYADGNGEVWLMTPQGTGRVRLLPR